MIPMNEQQERDHMMALLKRLVKVGYSLKIHHVDREWRNALEDTERFLMKEKKSREEQPKT